MNHDPNAERLRAADLDRYLATLYAPAAARPALFALHALDLELIEVARTTREPMVGMIRFAWWREALEKLDHAPPPAQPLLQSLAAEVLPRGVTGEDLSALEAGAAALIDEPFDRDAYLKGRGATLFALAAKLSGADGDAVRPAGRLWAAAELRRLRSDPVAFDEAVDIRPAPAPLRGLAALARRDLVADTPGARGAPGRQLRLLWSIISGR